MNANKDRSNFTHALGFGLRKFRAFNDSGIFNLAPLTCIVGANSSGKSSIISALLLLKQSLEQEAVSSRVSPLTLNGPYIDLGTFSDVVFRHDHKAQIGLDFSIPLSAIQDRDVYDLPIVRLAIPRSPLSRRDDVPYSYWRESLQLPEQGHVRIALSFATDEPFGPSISELTVESEGIGGVRFVRTTKGKRSQHWRTYAIGLPSRCFELRFSRTRFFPVITIRDSEYSRVGPRSKRRIKQVMTISRLAFAYLQQVFSDSYAIGPFRTSPERRYNFGGFSSIRGGKSGERAVDLLITEKLLSKRDSPLQRRVSFWLKHFHLAEEITVEDIARDFNLFAVNLYAAGYRGHSSISDVGYGISQILPIIVQGLLIRPGGIYMIQQPEIHLHPDAQAALADFLLYLSSKGIRVVVETHSEYLLIRLRLRMAQGKVKIGAAYYGSGNEDFKVKKEDVSVLLTAMRPRSGSTIRELAVSETFQFKDMPPGFMNQAMEDRIALMKELK